MSSKTRRRCGTSLKFRNSAQCSAGRKAHVELELEVHEIVRVETTTREDVWALRLLNSLTGINEIHQQGITRELPLYGWAGGIKLFGVADQITREGDDQWFLCDHKTRHAAGMPGRAQATQTHTQLMVYWYLFNRLVSGECSLAEYFGTSRLDVTAELSQSVVDHMSLNGIAGSTI